ncbi:hypothetical protein EDB85DRAFT_1891669 [Lactarius pseudohatsudake]|nr:hypothetical protein EDB85DRAFT_1891669 [Lactarius pseudohatsudake]
MYCNRASVEVKRGVKRRRGMVTRKKENGDKESNQLKERACTEIPGSEGSKSDGGMEWKMVERAFRGGPLDDVGREVVFEERWMFEVKEQRDVRRVRRDDGRTEEWGKRGEEEKDDEHELVAVCRVTCRADETEVVDSGWFRAQGLRCPYNGLAWCVGGGMGMGRQRWGLAHSIGAAGGGLAVAVLRGVSGVVWGLVRDVGAVWRVGSDGVLWRHSGTGGWRAGTVVERRGWGGGTAGSRAEHECTLE